MTPEEARDKLLYRVTEEWVSTDPQSVIIRTVDAILSDVPLLMAAIGAQREQRAMMIGVLEDEEEQEQNDE